MRTFKYRLFSGLVILSFGSCLASVQHKLASLRSQEKKQEAPAPASAEAATKPSAMPPVLDPMTTPATATTPQPEPSGKSEATVLLEQDTHPHRAFVHHSSRPDCPTTIETKVIYFDPGKAFLVIERCQQIEPKTLRSEHFFLASLDRDILLYENHILDLEVKPDAFTNILCEGGIDSAKRQISIGVEYRPADGGLLAQLIMKGSAGAEVQRLQVLAPTQKNVQTTVYQAGVPGASPYLNLTVANIRGLTGYLSYDLNVNAGAGVIGQNRKESNLNLSHCFTP